MLTVLGISIIVLYLWNIQQDLPDHNISKYFPNEITKIYDEKYELMYHVGNRDRFYLDFEDIPKNMINAIISAEDKTFFQHQGFDIKGIINAFIVNIKNIYSGKAFRPSICILVCTSFSGTLEMALPPSISVELVHNFSLIHDDGQSKESLNDAEIILVGVSRSGKTPTCLYLAVQFGVKAANYPITPDDLEKENLPEGLLTLKDKLFGLTIEPTRLSEIRYERFPNSKYATMENCKYEVMEAEILMQKYNIQFLSTTNKSIEEIASSLLQKINPETVTSTTY